MPITAPPTTDRVSRRFPGISRNVFALGWVSFLTDLASEMLYPVMPLFLVGTLGATPALLGVIDGVAEGMSSSLRWIGGALSDRLRKRKPFVVAGYAISALSKPVMGFAAIVLGWPLFFIGRCADRFGKSIRTAARDALIADSTPPEYRGQAFGFHRAADTCGAVLGPLVALAVYLYWRTVRANLHYLFFIALIPGLLSTLVAALAVRDIPHESPKDKPVAPPLLQPYPRSFWQLLAANALFSLGNSSDAFLMLRAREVGLTFASILLAFALYNAVYALAALPLGSLSDRIGRKPVLITGWVVYAAVYLGFAITRSTLTPWFLMAAYGLYQAMTEGVSKAFVTDVVPQPQRAGAIGLFYTASGIGQLLASILAGSLWTTHWFHNRALAAFTFGATCALAAVPLVAAVRPRQER